MILAAYLLSGLIGVGIIFLGARFLLAPATAASGYGVALPSSRSAEFTPWLSVKGVRDIVSGLLTFLLIANGSPPLLGEFLLVASLIPFGDAAIVLRSGGKRAAAFGIHGATALFMLALGAFLIALAR